MPKFVVVGWFWVAKSPIKEANLSALCEAIAVILALLANVLLGLGVLIITPLPDTVVTVTRSSMLVLVAMAAVEKPIMAIEINAVFFNMFNAFCIITIRLLNFE